MISVESHSKQIKLLNDYILALEKQVASARKENQEHMKNSSKMTEEMKNMNEEINRNRNDIGQLKYNNARQEEANRKHIFLEKELASTRQQFAKIALQNNRLKIVRQQIEDASKSHQEKWKTIQQQLKRKTQLFVQESYKDKQEIEQLKKTIIEKDKQREEITQLLNQERKNSVNKISTIEANNLQIVKIKNESFNKLSRDFDQLKIRYNKDMTSNSETRNSLGEQIKQLVNSSNEIKSEGLSFKKELFQTKQLLDGKILECDDLAMKLKAKTNDYDGYLKKSNQEKSNLLKMIQRLEQEKKKLQSMNTAHKGDINQNVKTLSESLKRIQQLSGKLLEVNQLISIKNDQLTQKQDEITNLNAKIVEINKQLIKRAEEARAREGYIKMLKNELETAKTEIQQLKTVKSSNLNKISEIDQITNKLKQELSETQSQLSSTAQQIQQKNLQIAKALNEIHNYQLRVKQNHFTITRLSNDISSRSQTIERLIATNKNLQNQLFNARNHHEQLDDLSTKLNEDLQLYKSLKINLEKQKQELSARLEQLTKEKIGDKDVLTSQISSRDKKIQQLSTKYEKFQSLFNLQSKNNTQIIKRLEAEKLSLAALINENNLQIENQKKKVEQIQTTFAKTKESLQTTLQEFNSYRKKKQTENEELSNQLKQSEKKNEKKTAKIEQLNQSIKQLENSHINHRKNLGDSQKEEMERQKAKFSKATLELTNQYEDALSKKQNQISQLKQLLERNLQQSEQKLKKLKDEGFLKEKTLNELIKQLQNQNDLLEKQVKKLNLTSFSEAQIKSTKEIQIQTLKKSMQKLEIYSKEQKNAIDQLNKLIDNKTKEIESLQSSNTMLRKQAISALNNQQYSRKQLLQTKSKVNQLINSSSRNSLTDFAPPNLITTNVRSSLISKKQKTTYTIKNDESKSNFRPLHKQKTQAEHMKISIVDDLNDSNFVDIKESQNSID